MTAKQALAATRAAIGASCWALPVPANKAFGITVADDSSPTMFYVQMAGTRDLALAAATASTQGDAARTVLRIGLATDAADAAACVLAARAGRISTAGAVLFVAAIAACSALGVKAHAEAR